MDEFYDRGRVPVRNLLANARRQADDRGFHEFAIVDVDSHHFENGRWREIAPFIEDDQIRDWVRAMTSRGKQDSARSGNVVTAQLGNQEVSGRILRAGQQLPGAIEAAARPNHHPDMARMLWAMDMMSIDYSIMFPSSMLHLSLHPAPEVEVVLARAYTRWLTEELLTQDDRVKTFVYLPFNDAAASLRVVEDFGDTPGVIGFMVTSVRYRPVHANEYAPVYSAIQETGKPLAFHAGYNWHEQSFAQLNKFISAHALGFTFTNMVHLTNMLVNAIPERFPRLKLMWLESGLAWLPFLMQRLDNEYLMRTSECPGLTRMPGDYLRDMWFSTQPMERTAPMSMLEETFKLIDAENTLVYSSDYPHWDFDVPSVIHDLPFLTDQAKRKILGGNACQLFGLPTEKRAPKSAADVIMPQFDAVETSPTLS
ncbi:amidohydrolase family protein [Kutzneria sp. NPDC052558]|uniref:amidohydrolase family protein n=1 Tax=Kutzneria sp. NPDC052558 TaxID=3364121 RepID=UPI0037C852F9